VRINAAAHQIKPIHGCFEFVVRYDYGASAYRAVVRFMRSRFSLLNTHARLNTCDQTEYTNYLVDDATY
jgi:hypothetical protein